jgi:hypothetical protein
MLVMGLLATAMFVTLFAFGQQILGYSDDDGMVRVALFATFVFGLLTGYRARG